MGVEPATLLFCFIVMISVAGAAALGGRTWAPQPGLRRGRGVARRGRAGRGSSPERTPGRRALGCGSGAMSPVGPLCQLRAAVRLGLPRAAAWGAGRRALGTRGAQAGADGQPGSRCCAARIGCASAFWGDTAAAGNGAAICTGAPSTEPSVPTSPEGETGRTARGASCSPGGTLRAGIG